MSCHVGPFTRSRAARIPRSSPRVSANSQVKFAAISVRGELLASKVFPAKYSNTCWSLIAPDDGVKVGASYEPTPEKIELVESFSWRRGNVRGAASGDADLGRIQREARHHPDRHLVGRNLVLPGDFILGGMPEAEVKVIVEKFGLSGI